jgi:hypothetical protein
LEEAVTSAVVRCVGLQWESAFAELLSLLPLSIRRLEVPPCGAINREHCLILAYLKKTFDKITY